MNNEPEKVPIPQKLTLTIKEAAEYSNIGINKIDRMLRSPIAPLSSMSVQRSWLSERTLKNTSERR